MLKIFKKMFDIEYKELKRFNEIANKIIDLEVEYGELSDSELAGKTEIFKERIENGEELDDILIEAFATPLLFESSCAVILTYAHEKQ